MDEPREFSIDGDGTVRIKSGESGAIELPADKAQRLRQWLNSQPLQQTRFIPQNTPKKV